MRPNNNNYDSFGDTTEVSWRDPNRYYEIISKLREEFLTHWSNENPTAALLKLQALHNTIFSYIIRSGRVQEFQKLFGQTRALIIEGNDLATHDRNIRNTNNAKAHAILGFTHQQIELVIDQQGLGLPKRDIDNADPSDEDWSKSLLGLEDGE